MLMESNLNWKLQSICDINNWYSGHRRHDSTALLRALSVAQYNDYLSRGPSLYKDVGLPVMESPR